MNKWLSTAALSLLLLFTAAAQSPINGVCTGLGHDDTAALQANINSAQGSTEVRFHGICVISASLTITDNIKFTGDGMNVTWLLPTASTFDAISYNPSNGVTTTQGVNMVRGGNATVSFERFSIQYPSVQNTTKYAIRLQAQNNLNITQPLIRDVGIYNSPNGILVYNSLGGMIERLVVMNFDGDGITINSPDSPDGGGMIVRGNSIVNYQSWNQATGIAGGNAIHYLSGGSLIVSGNHIAAVYNGLYGTLNGSSTQLTVDGNTFDTTTNTSIWLSRLNSSVQFAQVSITGNICATPVCLYVATDTPWITNLSFQNNQINGASAQNTSHVYIDATTGFQINGNGFISNSSGPTAINVGTHSSNGIVGPNLKIGPFAPNSIGGSGVTSLSPT